MFLALHFLLVFTVMLMTRISSTLVVSTMPIVTCVVLANNLGIMTNNVRVVINLLVFFLAMSDDNILTLLNLSHINNNIILYMAFHDVAVWVSCGTGDPSCLDNEDHCGNQHGWHLLQPLS